MRITGINEARCLGCRACIDDCPANLFSCDSQSGKILHQDPNGWCIGCGHCIACCPENAIDYQLTTTIPGRGFSFNGHPENFRFIMEFLCGKRSVRGFNSQEISDEDIKDITDAMRHAPSGHNIQACEYYIIRNRDTIQKLSELTIDYLKSIKKVINFRYFLKPFLTRYMYDILSDPGTSKGIGTLIDESLSGEDVIFHSAPVVVLISYPNVGRMSLADPVIATTYGMLAAHGKGLGSCWMGFTMDAIIKNKSARQMLGIEKDRLIGSVFTLGYPRTRYHSIPPRKKARIFTI